MWVIQYLQYPNPAGLKRVRVDRWSRTVYDRVPEPPPRGPRGADRITILEDTDGDGRADQAKDFVAGLNLATGMAFGHGGVFVLQVPYLLFYPDHNADDVPDADPDVLLSGFGMEDAHSVANSLTWGPDGWLYGCQGSTVTSIIRGIEFQQGVWRYHPITRRFELFCEGGGNDWGLDFDANGELFYSTNFGGYRMLHGVQGAYYWKSFGKHGPLHNPYAYGYFDHVPHEGFRGGHVTAGGIVYQGAAFPPRFRGTYIAADLLGHGVVWCGLEPWGSTFKSRHGGELLAANDTWFAPDDVTMGPDGAVYVADWHDRRTAHPDPDAEWDRNNGRIYKIDGPLRAEGTPRPDFSKPAGANLVSLLAGGGDWWVRKARRVLADRRDPEVIFPLRTLVLETPDDPLALEALWALYVSGGFTEAFAASTLAHRSPHVRRWTVRFLGDEARISSGTAALLAERARVETDATGVAQLAATAKRLPAAQALPIIERLAARSEFASDPYVPLLLWWAVERHADEAADRVMALCASPDAWKLPLLREAVLDRLMRRSAALGTGDGLEGCGALLSSAPSPSERARLLQALDQGLSERGAPVEGVSHGGLFARTAAAAERQAVPPSRPPAARVPESLEKLLDALWRDDTADAVLIGVAARLGRLHAYERARELVRNRTAPADLRADLVRLLGEIARPEGAETLVFLIDSGDPDAVWPVVLDTLQQFDQSSIASSVLRNYRKFEGPLKTRAIDLLLGRRAWALPFLRGIDGGVFHAADVSTDQVRQVTLHADPELDAIVRKRWGSVAAGTPEEKLAEMRRLANDLRAGDGDAVRGREQFRKRCATCHTLFGEGAPVGPDLTHANRKDREFLLASLVDPSAVIRRDFLSYVVKMKDGRVLTGLIADESGERLALARANDELTAVAREEIEAMQESPVSLMPENLLREVSPQELRDLFSHLESDGPSNAAR